LTQLLHAFWNHHSKQKEATTLKAVIRVIIWICIVTFAIGFLACLAMPFDRTSGIPICQRSKRLPPKGT
ncbi:MAG: hypothetical protein E7J87_10300, partial [Streptococcus sp.]|uniref:hypothetical protein n=1 Tax=Streptococcus sp. TaxID=1306 RepID=UPI00290A2C1B